MKRVFLIVLDSFGIGEAPDADKFGDVGANTLRTISGSPKFNCPNMTNLDCLMLKVRIIRKALKIQ